MKAGYGWKAFANQGGDIDKSFLHRLPAHAVAPSTVHTVHTQHKGCTDAQQQLISACPVVHGHNTGRQRALHALRTAPHRTRIAPALRIKRAGEWALRMNATAAAAPQL